MKNRPYKIIAIILLLSLLFGLLSTFLSTNATEVLRPTGVSTQTNAANQKWAFIPINKDSATWYKIKSVSSGLVLTIEGTTAGSYVKEATDLGSDDTQLWSVTIVQAALWNTYQYYGNAIKPKLADPNTTNPTFLTCSDTGIFTIRTSGWGDNIEQSFQFNGSYINTLSTDPNIKVPNPGVAYTISRKNWGNVNNFKTLESTAPAIIFVNKQTVSSVATTSELNQKWFFIPVVVSGTTYYKISSAYTGKYLTATFAEGQTYIAVTTTDEIDNCDFQLWQIMPGGTGHTDKTCIVNKAIPNTLVTDGTVLASPNRIENAVVKLLSTGRVAGNSFFVFNGNSLLDPTNAVVANRRIPIPGTAYEIKTLWYSLTTLTANGTSKENKALIVTNKVENDKKQQWVFSPVEIGAVKYYKIVSSQTGLLLTSLGNVESSKVCESPDLGVNDSQLWSISTSIGNYDGEYLCIQNKGSTLYLDYRDNNLAVRQNNKSELQGFWQLNDATIGVPLSNVAYTITLPNLSGFEGFSGQAVSSTQDKNLNSSYPVIMEMSNAGISSQRWLFNKVQKEGNDYFTVRNARTGNYLTGTGTANNSLVVECETIDTNNNNQLWTIVNDNTPDVDMVCFTTYAAKRAGSDIYLDFRNGVLALRQNWRARAEGVFFLNGQKNLNPSSNVYYLIQFVNWGTSSPFKGQALTGRGPRNPNFDIGDFQGDTKLIIYNEPSLLNNQKWIIKKVGNYFTIQSKSSKKYLTNTPYWIEEREYTGNNNQLWRFDSEVWLGQQYYRIYNVQTGRDLRSVFEDAIQTQPWLLKKTYMDIEYSLLPDDEAEYLIVHNNTAKNHKYLESKIPYTDDGTDSNQVAASITISSPETKDSHSVLYGIKTKLKATLKKLKPELKYDVVWSVVGSNGKELAIIEDANDLETPADTFYCQVDFKNSGKITVRASIKNFPEIFSDWTFYVNPDFSSLQETVLETYSLDQNDYTVNSFNVLSALLKKSDEIQNDLGATQEQINTLINNINEAVKHLEKVNNEKNQVISKLIEPTTVSSATISLAVQKKREIIYQTVDSNNSLLYEWSLKAENIYNDRLSFNTGVAFDSENKKIIDEMTGNAAAVYLTLAQEGAFPGEMGLKVYVGNKFKNPDLLKLYYLNSVNGKPELYAEGVNVVNGFAELIINQGSQYFLTKGKVSEDDDVLDSNSDYEDFPDFKQENVDAKADDLTEEFLRKALEISEETATIRLRTGVLTKAMQQLLVDSRKALTIELEDSNNNVYFIWNFPVWKNALEDISLKVDRTTPFANDINKGVSTKNQMVLLSNQNPLPKGTRIIFGNTGGFEKGDKIELLSFNTNSKKLAETTIMPIMSNDQKFLALSIFEGGIYVVAKKNSIAKEKESNSVYLIIGILIVILLLGIWGTFLLILIKNKRLKRRNNNE